MQMMLTDKEYQLLINMLFLSDWIMNSYRTPAHCKDSEYKILFHKILAIYAQNNSDDYCVYSKETKGYFIQSEQEEKLMESYVDPYDNYIFWDELVERLSMRDLIETVGEQAYQAMDGMERVNRLEKLREQYFQEFEKNGLDNLKLNYSKITLS